MRKDRAGIHAKYWIPACAGITGKCFVLSFTYTIFNNYYGIALFPSVLVQLSVETMKQFDPYRAIWYAGFCFIQSGVKGSVLKLK